MTASRQDRDREPPTTRSRPERATPARTPQDAVVALAQEVGNQAMTSLVAPDHGRALPESVRRRLEGRLDAPLGDVRVHVDDRAEAVAGALGARAVARGEHIHFARGEYRPETTGGADLLAHELAHVVQQRSGPGATGSRATAEAEADASSSGEATPTPGSAPAGAVQLAAEPRGRQRYPDLPWDNFAKAYATLTPAQQRQLDAEESTPLQVQAAAAVEEEAAATRGPEPGPLAKVQAAATAAHETAGEIVSSVTGLTLLSTLRNLGPAQQGEKLAAAANDRTLTCAQIAEALDSADSPERVAFAFMNSKLMSPLILSQMSATREGRYLLDRLFIWTTEGMTGPIEGFVRGMLPVPLADDSAAKSAQASRIMRERVHAVPISRWATAQAGKMKVFPFQMQGLTTFGQTPMDIQVTPDGKLMVGMNTKLAGLYPEEYKTLPPDIMTKRVEIDPEEIIAVRRYDKNGAMEYMPAIYLLQLGREYETNTAGKIQTIAGVGSAIGGGGLSGAGTTGVGAALANLDAAIVALGAVSLLVDENRPWLEAEGWGGFLDELDLLNAAASIYGLGRLVHGAPEMLRNLHESYTNARERQRLGTEAPSPDHAAVLQQIERQVATLPKPPSEGTSAEAPKPLEAAAPAEPAVGSAPTRGAGAGAGAGKAARKRNDPVASGPRARSKESRKAGSGHRETRSDTGIGERPTEADVAAATGTHDVAPTDPARPRLELIKGGRDPDAPRAMAGDAKDPSSASSGSAPAPAPAPAPATPGGSGGAAPPVAATAPPAEAVAAKPPAAKPVEAARSPEEVARARVERDAKFKAERAERLRKAELDRLYAAAEKKAAKSGYGPLDGLEPVNRDFVEASGRNKELAYDPAHKGWTDQSVAEARAVLDAEAKGHFDNPPVKRNLANTSDFIDSKGTEIDHYGPKGLDLQADINSLVVKLTERSYEILLDTVDPDYEAKLIADVRATLQTAGKPPELIRRVISSRRGRYTP